MPNPYCEALGIEVPTLERAMRSPDANVYSLLIAALLERGGPMTLREVAARFDSAGVAPAERALLSLQRCKPGRAPVYREGDLYALDPHDHDADLWTFRLGLRPARGPRLSVARPVPEPPPDPAQPLTVAELDAAWRDASLHAWPAYRLTLAVLEARGQPMEPQAVVDFLAERTRWHGLSPDSKKYLARRSPVRVRDDGRWEIGDDRDALLSTRRAVRERLAMLRRQAADRVDPAEIEAGRKASERRRAAHAAELAALSRVLVHAFPPDRPQAVVLIDVGQHTIETFLGADLEGVPGRIEGYDVIAAVDVRGLLRRLGIDPEGRRLAELGPPQKTKQLNQRGRTLQITLDLLVRGTCNVARPFSDPRSLARYFCNGQTTRFRRRLEADAKSLYALYQYGRLHGTVRLRWGFLDEVIPAPWVHPDELRMYGLVQHAAETGAALEVVTGSAPGWSDPWSRARRCRVARTTNPYRFAILDELGFEIDERDVQAARLFARQ